MNNEFEQFKAIVDRSRTFVLTTHVNPDGDGLGSETALASYLRSLGKEAVILNHSATPPNYAFLNDVYPIEQFAAHRHSKIVAEADAILVLDSNHPDRLVSLQDAVLASRATKVCIDHHLEPSPFAELYILDESSTATGEIVYRLVSYLNHGNLSKDIAISLYTAIMTDTGSFKYPKTDPDVHHIIAELIEKGADPVWIYDQVYEQGTAGRLRLLGEGLSGLRTSSDGKIAYIVLSQEMFHRTGASESDTDAFVPYTLSIKNVQIGLMFTELADCIKINFRSKGDIWVNELAKQFGGNGHKNAAGARVATCGVANSKLDQLISQVVDKAKTFTR
ncbi:MAG: bifunctional oligoribonuclease/PAP phosphatase NrnA [Ignavibacteriales bacterium]|nr:bifunctional oligoribonuclease/PAP phosphatase NrnA [Ignavibacteriales bacterium]